MSLIEEGWKITNNNSGEKITEMEVSGAVICKFDSDGRRSILLIQRASDDHWPNYWEFPRGKCDKTKTEDIMDCLKREVKEETNLDVEPIVFIDKFSYENKKDKKISTQHNYLCYLKPGNQELKLSREHQDYKWISTPGEVELLVFNEMGDTLKKVFSSEESLTSKSGKVEVKNKLDSKIEECLNYVLENL